MAQPDRLVLLDDTNPSIQYSGPWFTAQDVAPADTGGPAFQNTLHGVNVDGNFSFSFSGSRVAVLGTSITGARDTIWECFVDNASIGSTNSGAPNAENNLIFCQADLQDGPHVLSLEAKVSNQQTFWFDQIRYVPSSNVSLDQSILRVDEADDAVKYSSGWKPAYGFVYITQTARDTLTFQFSGTSLSWVGFVPSNFSLISSSATYSIDDQTPINFLVPAVSSSGPREFSNQIFFRTGQLSAGQHKLVVTYQGNSGTAPLSLDYFVLQNAPSSSTYSSNAPTHTGDNISSGVPSHSSTSSSTTTRPTGAIVGGVIGGLVLILLLLTLFLFIRRRNSRRAQAFGDKSYSDTPYDTADPFTALPTHPALISILPSQNHTSNGHSLTSQSIGNKFAHRNQPSDAPSTSSNTTPPFISTHTSSSVSGGGIPALVALQNHPTPAAGSQINGSTTPARVTETVDLARRSVSPRGGDARLLRHEDSGVRLPPVEDDIVELPPFYVE